jgi:hypothetical protein
VFQYRTSEHLEKVQDTGITDSLLPQLTFLAEATITCRLVILLLNAAFRQSVPSKSSHKDKQITNHNANFNIPKGLQKYSTIPVTRN